MKPCSANLNIKKSDIMKRRYTEMKVTKKPYSLNPENKMRNILVSLLLIITPLIFTTQSCRDQKEDIPAEIRNRISEYQKEISDLNRKINLLEKQLSEMGEQVENRSGTSVTVTEITTGPFDNYFRINGSVEAVREAMISPEINGQLKNIYVNKGQRVERGQPVARLNTSVLENNIEELKTNMNLARTVYERQKSLWDQQIGSEIQYLEAKNAYESLQSRLRSLESQLEMAILNAPFSGIVDEIFLKEGELAIPGSPVMQIVNLDRLYVNADVAETYLPVIAPDNKVILRFPAYPEYESTLPLHRIGNVINPENRTFRVQLRIDNPGERFKPNMIASLNIKSFSADDVIVIPTILIKQDIQGHFVYTARQNGNGTWVAHRSYIERGAEGEGRTMINKGLKEGDILIVQGHNQLTEGLSLVIEQS
jgi:membrane fusion protein, multidrug efflux system